MFAVETVKISMLEMLQHRDVTLPLVINFS